MKPASVFFLLFLTTGCQSGSFHEILSTVPSLANSEPTKRERMTTPALATRVQGTVRGLSENSSEEMFGYLRDQIQELHERTADDLDAETASILLNARFKVFLLRGEQQNEIEKFSLRVSKKFAGLPVGLDAATVHFMVTHDLTKELGIQDFKDLRASAHSIPSDNDKAALYSVIVRKLHANGKTQSAKLALDMGLAHLKGTDGLSQLFHEQFALGFKQNPKPGFGGEFKERKGAASAKFARRDGDGPQMRIEHETIVHRGEKIRVTRVRFD